MKITSLNGTRGKNQSISEAAQSAKRHASDKYRDRKLQVFRAGSLGSHWVGNGGDFLK